MMMILLIKKIEIDEKINKQHVNLAKEIDKNLNKYLIEKSEYQNLKIDILLKRSMIF